MRNGAAIPVREPRLVVNEDKNRSKTTRHAESQTTNKVSGSDFEYATTDCRLLSIFLISLELLSETRRRGVNGFGKLSRPNDYWCRIISN